MIRRVPHAALAIALLLFFAATAWAESSEGPVRRRPWRERTKGEGVLGLTMFRTHAGFSAPTGDLADGFNTGWGGGISIAHGVSRTVLVSSGFAYHAFDQSPGSGDLSIVPWTINADAVIPTESHIRPWIGGGLGLYHIDWDREFLMMIGGFPVLVTRSDDENNIGINMGMGLGGPLGPRTLWGAGFKFHHIFEGDIFNDLDFFTFQFGLGFTL